MPDYTDTELHDAIVAVEARVTAVEARPNPTDQQAAIDALRADLTALQTTSSSQTSALNALTTRVAALESPPPSTNPTVSVTFTPTSTVAGTEITATVVTTNADHWKFDWHGGTSVGIVHPATETSVKHTYDQPGTFPIDVRAWRDSDNAEVNAHYTMVVQGAQAATIGQQFGGIATPIGQISDHVRHARELSARGFSWLRTDFGVKYAFPTQSGARNFGAWWSIADPYAAEEISVNAILYLLPQWMNGSTNDKTQPTTEALYANMAAEAAPLLYQHGVRCIELWNEPNWGFWLPRANRPRYVAFAKAAAAAIRQTEPRMLIITGGVSTADTEYGAPPGTPSTNKTVNRFDTGASYTSPELGANQTLDIWGALGLFAAKDAAGRPLFDGVGIHPYLDGVDPGVDATDPNWMEWRQTPMRRVIAILDRWGGQALKVWNTESAVGNQSEAVKATRAANAYDFAFNKWTLVDGVTKMRTRLGPYFYFTLIKWTGQPARELSFSLENADYSALPAIGSVQGVLDDLLV